MNQKLIVLAIIVGLVVVGLVASNNQLGILNTQATTQKVTIKTTPASCDVAVKGGLISIPVHQSSGTTGAVFYFPFGIYTVTITKTGYATKTVPLVVMSAPISISATLTATTPAPPVTYTLTVKTSPIGCTVAAGGTSKVSDASGNAVFTLAAGTYSVAVSKTGYTAKTVSISLTSSSSTTVTLSAIATPPPPPPTPPPTYILTVKTIPALSCTVSVSSYTKTTSSLIGVTFTLPKASYTVTTSKTGFTTKTQTVSLDSNTNILVILVSTTPTPPTPPPTPPPSQVTCYQCQGGNVVSQLFTGSCGSGWFIDPPDCYVPPVPQYYNLQVTVKDAVTQNSISGANVVVGGKSISTGVSGTATFSSLAENSYAITVTKTGYQTTPGTATIYGSDSSAEIQMVPNTYNIILTITDSSQTPISGASVTIGGNQPQMTDAQGKTTFTSMPSSTYSISITKQGYNAITDSVTVSSIDVTKTIYMTSTPVVPSTFTLTVYTHSNASVTISNVYAAATPPTPIQTTLPSGLTGVAIFTNLPSGTYTLTIKKDGYTTKTERVTITDNQAVNAPIEPLSTPPKAIPGFEAITLAIALGITMIIIYKRKKNE